MFVISLLCRYAIKYVNVKVPSRGTSVNTGGNAGPPPAAPGEFVEERFSWLHDLTEEIEGQPSQLSELISRLTEVYQELNKLSFAGGVGAGASEANAIVRFQELANRLPGPIQRWSTQISSGSSGITADGTLASRNAQWQALGFTSVI